MSTLALVALILLLLVTGVSVLCAILIARDRTAQERAPVHGKVAALSEIGYISVDPTTGAFNIYLYKEEMPEVLSSIGHNVAASLYAGPMTGSPTSTTEKENMI